MAKWVEEFFCGCTHSTRSKRGMVGYCPLHGSDVRNIYKESKEWTRNKPTEPGWYWWRHNNRATVVEAFAAFDTLWVDDLPLRECLGEWLGPITPDSYQQGRVAGLQEAGDLHEQVNTYCDHEPKAGAGGMGVAIRYRDLIRQQATKLAQQAQDEKGGGDGKDCL